jgi:competence protein CoiA
MPLRCTDPTGQNIYSFDLTDDAWQALQLENRRWHQLKMPCCGSHVTMKKSRRGTPFFAHTIVGPCATAPEREEHLQLKAVAVAAARASGWTAETEVAGATPSGEPWRADVLASKGKHRVAIEIQWSNQTAEETVLRQRRYRESDIRGLWLFRRPGFPVSRDLPAVRVHGTWEDDFTISVAPNGSQIMTPGEFFRAAFSGRFRFGIPLGAGAVVSIRGGFAECWYDGCQAQTRIVTGIDVVFGPHTCSFTVSELGEHRQLLMDVIDRLPADLGVGQIKPRFSKMLNASYVSNGCVRCDRLFGEHFEHEAWESQQILCSFPIRISADWNGAIAAHGSYEASWGVYGARPDPAAIAPPAT